jgi:hypothetical protein
VLHDYLEHTTWVSLDKSRKVMRYKHRSKMLIKVAASKWQGDKVNCYAMYGKAMHKPSGKSIAYDNLFENT